MLRMQSLVVCAVLALVASSAQAARQAKVEGTISAINAVSIPPTITIAGASGDVTLKISSATRVQVGDERGVLADLTVGAEVKAHYDVGSQIARKIQILIEETEEDATTVGVVLSVDPVAGTIALDTNGDTIVDLTLTTNAQTRIKVGGVVLTSAELSALVGQRVKVEYNTTTFLASEIEAEEDALVSARGTVTAVDAAAGTLTIETASGPLSFEVADGAVIRIGSQTVGLAEVLVGDTVHVLYLDAETNLAVRVTVAPPRPLHINGTVTATDGAAGTITVTRGATSVVLALTANSDLRINGRAATLADVQAALTAGRTVKVSASYFARAGVNVATNVRVNVQGRGRR